ncbi:MAG: lipopolysaccharide biosynthesis protein [Acidobacteria bacterium]|nr:lipopolysaccharide biosynthesis protein [Acidobacteriota bacterium]
MNSIFRPTLVLMSGRMLSFIVTFCIPVVLVRVFSPTEYGTYKQIFLIFGTANAIAQFGMAESLFYFVPRSPAKAGRYVFNALLMLLIAGVLCWWFIARDSSRISGLLSNQMLTQYLPLLGAYLLLMMLSATLEIVMISRKEYRWAAFCYGFSDLVRAVLLIAPAYLFHALRPLLWGAVLFAAVRFATAIVYFARQFGSQFRPDVPSLRQQLAYALPFEMAVVLDTLQANFHQYAVSHYFDVATFAIYSVGCLQIPLIDLLATPASNVMMVQMSEEVREGRTAGVLNIWHETTRKLALVFFPLFGLALVTAAPLITFLFTSTYSASVPIFMVWSVSILFAALQTDGVLRVYAQTRLIFILGLLRLVFIAASIYVALSWFGLLGAVFVTIGALALGKVFALCVIKRLMRVSTAKLLPWSSIVSFAGVTAASSLMAFGIGSLLQVHVLAHLLISGTVFTVTYVALLFGFGLLTNGERLALTGWFDRFSTAVEGVKEIQ